MNTNTGSIVYRLTGILAALGAMTIILLYLFEGNIGGTLLYLAIASGVFCVFLIYTIIINARSLIQQPFSIYIVVGFYLIVCLLLCFPNRYMEEWALIYLIAVPIACFYGFRHAVVVILCATVLSVYSIGEIGRVEIQHIAYILIAALAASGKKQIGMDLLAAFAAFVSQGILLLVSRNVIAADTSSFLMEFGIVLINSFAIPVVYRLAALKETGQGAAEEKMAEETGTEQTEEQPVPVVTILPSESAVLQEETAAITQTVQNPMMYGYPMDISYLISEECVILKSMKEFAPRAFNRAMEIAAFARSISYKFGANSDLVYAAALYHDVERIYKEEPGAAVVLPEYLYTIVKRQNEKQPPISIEELIVLLSNHVLAIYHYMEKNNANISISKVIDNIFNLQLKKGNIMSVGISMSVYHKMKQEFTNEFLIYLEDKKK